MFSGKTRSARSKKLAVGLNIAVIAVAVPAIFCTIALPAYASHNSDASGAQATADLQHLKTVDAQTAELSADAAGNAPAATARDSFTATSQAEIDAAKAAAERAKLKTAYATYSGPSVRSYLANPPYPNFDLNQVVAVAEKYQGVPYRYGGADPSGFDCSGFTMFVYAQFGIALPHSAARQGAGGISISPADAKPGDLVAMDGGGHIGIYLGGNMMIDAPEPGRVVQIRQIYTAAHWFVRYGA